NRSDAGGHHTQSSTRNKCRSDSRSHYDLANTRGYRGTDAGGFYNLPDAGGYCDQCHPATATNRRARRTTANRGASHPNGYATPYANDRGATYADSHATTSDTNYLNTSADANIQIYANARTNEMCPPALLPYTRLVQTRQESDRENLY